MTVNQAALALIKEFEGFRASTYRCSAGKLTIGYGTTAAAGVGVEPYMGLTITEAAAERYLLAALEKFGAQIAPYLHVELNENQYGAILSLAYNIGPGAFSKSTLLRKLNARDFAGAAAQFDVWNKSGGQVLAGLVRRRAAEKALFMTPSSSSTKLAVAPAAPTTAATAAQPSVWHAIITAFQTLATFTRAK